MLFHFDILMIFNVSLLLSCFRIVQPELKSLALGFHSMVIRALGMMKNVYLYTHTYIKFKL